jgi:hypothetical protein
MDNQKINFIHIPKTGGLSVFRSLKKAGVFHNKQHTLHRLASERLNDDDINNAINFSIVRNPYSRMRSLYDYYYHSRNEFIFGDVSFKKFVMTFEEKYYKQYYPFYTCYDYLTDKDGNIMVDDIIKFETLSKDYNSFCKKYNIQSDLLHINKNIYKPNKVDYKKMYDEEMKEVVEKIFKKDFELFDYSYEKYIDSL